MLSAEAYSRLREPYYARLAVVAACGGAPAAAGHKTSGLVQVSSAAAYCPYSTYVCLKLRRSAAARAASAAYVLWMMVAAKNCNTSVRERDVG